VRNYTDALASNADAFRRVFHAALDAGIYLPPSPYETCFLSTTHDADALDRTIEVLGAAIAGL
jgi:glutamate-1-semialdehyde 2,1-aminomutase